MPELWELSAEEIARRVRARECSAVEVLSSSLARTEKVEPLISSYLEIYAEEALARAEALDRQLAAGEDIGPLAGVPIALKDNLSLEGHRLTCASRILEGYVSPYTATCVERLLAAGAVPLGRANMDEFAMGSSCENSGFGVTRNPWDLSRVPGGSSGGPAAAVAAASVPLGFGSDTGGSVRLPAALCGLVGVKPTYGRVSRHGLVAFASSTDQVGPLCRDVRSAALALGVIAGTDENDATCSTEPVDDYLSGIEEGMEGLRVGVIREIEQAGLSSEAALSWRSSLDLLREAGADLVEVSLPSLEAAVAIYYVIATSEASANLARFDGVRYGHRSGAASDLASLYVESRSEGFGAEVKRRIMLGTFALSSGYYEAYYGRALAVLETLRRELDTCFTTAQIVVTPTAPATAFRLGEKVDDPLSMYLSDIFTTPASLVGIPAVAVPAGTDGEGLPWSLQLMGPAFSEALLLRAGRAYERLLDWRAVPTFRPSGRD